ncbi:Exocyst complex subunit Exo70, C-terminal [Dillenia turbinata]|uniref:Exocyst complex subunit Exo70, C-terminal n=1 Tax=Dillenia turbinata TaxID=194707 RepID=A0AAN8Z492_9MAGN
MTGSKYIGGLCNSMQISIRGFLGQRFFNMSVQGSVDVERSSGVTRVMVKERFKTFNAQFEKLHQRQSQWIVLDSELRKNPQKYIRYSIEDLDRMLSEFFEGRT